MRQKDNRKTMKNSLKNNNKKNYKARTMTMCLFYLFVKQKFRKGNIG